MEQTSSWTYLKSILIHVLLFFLFCLNLLLMAFMIYCFWSSFPLPRWFYSCFYYLLFRMYSFASVWDIIHYFLRISNSFNNIIFLELWKDIGSCNFAMRNILNRLVIFCWVLHKVNDMTSSCLERRTGRGFHTQSWHPHLPPVNQLIIYFSFCLNYFPTRRNLQV